MSRLVMVFIRRFTQHELLRDVECFALTTRLPTLCKPMQRSEVVTFFVKALAVYVIWYFLYDLWDSAGRSGRPLAVGAHCGAGRGPCLRPWVSRSSPRAG